MFGRRKRLTHSGDAAVIRDLGGHSQSDEFKVFFGCGPCLAGAASSSIYSGSLDHRPKKTAPWGAVVVA
ncbi:hypothetical protein, partial [Ottowia sp.]|uniref:hypothetical protein n=1 Tax=Ottowia sp. TaxID=1898956 RepID=UPI00261D5214